MIEVIVVTVRVVSMFTAIVMAIRTSHKIGEFSGATCALATCLFCLSMGWLS